MVRQEMEFFAKWHNTTAVKRISLERYHQCRYLRICHFAMILAIIADHYLIFGMLFMQLRGKVRRPYPTSQLLLCSTSFHPSSLVLRPCLQPLTSIGRRPSLLSFNLLTFYLSTLLHICQEWRPLCFPITSQLPPFFHLIIYLPIHFQYCILGRKFS